MPITNRQRQIGTLHSFAYHAFDQPKIAESFVQKSSDQSVMAWNDSVSPSYRLTGGSGGSRVSAEEMTPDTMSLMTEADRAFASINNYRARMVPPALWPALPAELWRLWSDWKRVNGLVDFTDLIENALEEIPIAPGNPRMILSDESQDLSTLQYELIKKWGGYADRFLMGMDLNQAIFTWAGADPRRIMDEPIDPQNIHRLRRSYRMARAVHENAQRWISTAERAEIFDFEPRDEEGEVRVSDAHFRDPARVLGEVKYYLDQGKEVMVLATTSRALDPVKHEMRAQGVVFANPWRQSRGDWNPLGAMGRAGQVSTGERLIAFLQPRQGLAGPVWTAEQLQQWSELTKSTGVMRRGANSTLKRIEPDTEIDYWQAQEIFTDEAMTTLFDEAGGLRQPSLRWLTDNLLESKRKAAGYPLAIIQRGGIEELQKRPRCYIGTAHSFKGAEADVVIICPDLSPAGYREWAAGGASRDAIIRLMYVALSRARETVVVCKPATGLSVPGLVG